MSETEKVGLPIAKRNTDIYKFKMIDKLLTEKKPKDIESAKDLIRSSELLMINPSERSFEQDKVTYFDYFFNNNENSLNLYLEKNGQLYSTVFVQFNRIEKFDILRSLPVEYIEDMKNKDDNSAKRDYEDEVIGKLISYKPKGNHENIVKKIVYDQHHYFGLDRRTTDEYKINPN